MGWNCLSIPKFQRMSNFIPHIKMDAITYLHWDLRKSMLVTGAPNVHAYSSAVPSTDTVLTSWLHTIPFSFPVFWLCVSTWFWWSGHQSFVHISLGWKFIFGNSFDKFQTIGGLWVLYGPPYLSWRTFCYYLDICDFQIIRHWLS